MNVNDLYLILSCLISTFINIFTYKIITESKIKIISLKNISIIIVTAVIIYLKCYINLGLISSFFSFVLIFLSNFIIYKDSFLKTMFYTIFCYVSLVIFELLFAFLLVMVKYDNAIMLKKNIIVKSIYSILITLFSLTISYSYHIRKRIEKLFLYLSNSKMMIVLIFFITFIPIGLAFRNVLDFSSDNYFLNLILFLVFIIMFVYANYSSIVIIKETKKSDTLTNQLSEYEKKIEEDSILRHEILNDLLILKSIENKTSEYFENALDDLIKLYGNNKIGIKNITKLPNGLKKIIYTKLKEANNNKINTKIYISKQIDKIDEKLEYKKYICLGKIIANILDNAIEAAKDSKEKIMFVNIYSNKHYINVDIINSFSNKIDLKNINKKNFSTKGKARGLGLYIVSNILKNNEYIEMNQIIENSLFTTNIQINKKYFNINKTKKIKKPNMMK